MKASFKKKPASLYLTLILALFVTGCISNILKEKIGFLFVVILLSQDTDVHVTAVLFTFEILTSLSSTILKYIFRVAQKNQIC